MKSQKITIIFILYTILNMLNIHAQRTGGFEPQIKMSFGHGFDKDKVNTFGVTFIGGLRTSNTSWVGLGVGYFKASHIFPEGRIINYNGGSADQYVKYHNASCFPIFLTGKYNWVEKLHWLPYIGLDAGFIIYDRNGKYNKSSSDVGIFIKPAVGIDYRFDNNTLSFEIGYRINPSIMNIDGYSQFDASIGYSRSF